MAPLPTLLNPSFFFPLSPPSPPPPTFTRSLVAYPRGVFLRSSLGSTNNANRQNSMLLFGFTLASAQPPTPEGPVEAAFESRVLFTLLLFSFSLLLEFALVSEWLSGWVQEVW